ncbi:bifunctional helix-turn-helix transcriptional regulator/GNAT family N-acetyltransferase [Lutibaculum baratangense]|uniref:MarR-family protein transcriptional regulator n=1 Tax=Lutibaculum baratangense AMV1 TaxID=631454 RepID=V4RV53_9HYPH|nr:helix-turn-helix domain-containing GNAT family N-acetyltransferase [Lutibaculum baratangense]ESR26905.1 MarR-family protein transcriptional regulator [Lutibaculum baratangense AMV1]
MHDETIEAVRSFSRFYTRKIEVLGDGILKSRFSLAQVRVLYEIAHGADVTAADLARTLATDPGQLSRMLRGLERQRLIRKEEAEGRRLHLRLTDAGVDEMAALEEASRDQLRRELSHLGPADERALREAMRRVERLMTPPSGRPRAIVLRPPRPGDLGWVVSRHGAIYAEEYGWDSSFEALVADIVAEFDKAHDPRRERVLIGEVDGEPAGSVFLVRQDEETAKLRLLFVESWARGTGLGRRLVETVIADARALGYRRIVLWTNDCLTAARSLYERLGFRMVASEPHHSFGHDLVGETWELEL